MQKRHSQKSPFLQWRFINMTGKKRENSEMMHFMWERLMQFQMGSNHWIFCDNSFRII